MFNESIDNKSKNNENLSKSMRDNELVVTEFNVKIIDYKKVASFMETFVVFTIETTGNFRPYSVERRFNDFQWLFQRLIERYPMAIIPPLPNKHNLSSIERFSGIFIDQRRDALDKFLQRLNGHHILGLDQEFWFFLTLLPTKFNDFKRDNPVLGKVETLLQSIQSLSVLASGINTVNNIPDSGFIKLVDDTVKMNNIMNWLVRVVKRTGQVWDNIGQICLEGGVQIDKWPALGEVGHHCTEMAKTTQCHLEPWVVESALSWAQLEQAARRRNDIELRFVASLAKQSRPQDNTMRIEQAKQVTNKLHDILTKNNADLRSELDQWQPVRSLESKLWMKELSDMHIDYYKQTSAIWRQMVTNMTDYRVD